MKSELDAAKIKQAGVDIEENVTQMYQSLERVKTLINESRSFFDSDSARKMRNKFNTSAEKFDEYKNFLKTYGEYLKNFSGNVVRYNEAVSEGLGDIPDL